MPYIARQAAANVLPILYSHMCLACLLLTFFRVCKSKGTNSLSLSLSLPAHIRCASSTISNRCSGLVYANRMVVRVPFTVPSLYTEWVLDLLCRLNVGRVRSLQFVLKCERRTSHKLECHLYTQQALSLLTLCELLPILFPKLRLYTNSIFHTCVCICFVLPITQRKSNFQFKLIQIANGNPLATISLPATYTLGNTMSEWK